YLTVQYPELRIRNIGDLKMIPICAPGQPRATSLDAVSKIERVSGPTEVAHYGLRKVVDVYVSLASEDLGKVAEAVQGAVSKTELPKGVRVDLRGMLEGMRASFRSFAMGLLLAVLLLYLILVAQFKSFVDPLLILLAVPVGLTGVLALLYATGT